MSLLQRKKQLEAKETNYIVNCAAFTLRINARVQEAGWLAAAEQGCVAAEMTTVFQLLYGRKNNDYNPPNNDPPKVFK